MILPTLYPLTGFRDGYLAMMGRPRSGEWLQEEVAGLHHLGIHIVVSLLQRKEIEELELCQEEQICHQYNLLYYSFPIPDRGVPDSFHATRTFVQEVYEQLLHGKRVVIHCRAGIGRASLLATCIFIHAQFTPDDALASIGHDRHLPVPDTEEQTQWLTAYYQAYINGRKNIAEII